MSKYIYQPSADVKTIVKNELDKCIGCKKCMKKCPMLKEHCDNPKTLLKLLDSDQHFEENLKSYRMPFTCTNCSYCEQVCPKDVELNTVFYTLKSDIVRQNGFPKFLGKTVIDTHQSLSFSNVFSTKIRLKSSKSSQTQSKRKVIFYPGCSPSAHSPNMIQGVQDYMNEHVESILFKKCCGNPTLSVGQIDKFNAYTNPLVKDVTLLDPEAIVVLCMNCHNTLSKLFPKIEVLTLWEFMIEHGLPNTQTPINGPTFTLHDPCPTRKHSKIHNAVRQVLSIGKIDYEEFEHNKDQTVCCGSGAMLSVIHPNLAQAHKSMRASEAGTDHILSYCQECTESLKLNGKKTLHLLDLFFNDTMGHSFDQCNQSTLTKWMNRRKVKRNSDMLLMKREKTV